MKKTFLLCAVCFWGFLAKAQYIIRNINQPLQTSILDNASITDAGHKLFTIQQLLQDSPNLQFKQLHGKNGNLGFTSHNYWLKFAIKNDAPNTAFYYLQTAEPVTNNVDLYLIDKNGAIQTQRSGDELDFSKKALPFNKTLFSISLKPGETKQAFIEIKNDGEKNRLPLQLISPQKLLENIYKDQLVMGLFYGVLFAVAITYFFFYFGLLEVSFLYYSLYVSFMGLCQFALDGFYHQYIGQSNSWFNLHFVIITAVFAAYCFGKYSEVILETKTNNPFIHQLFKGLYIALATLLAGIIFVPALLPLSYPAVNLLTLVGMLLIFTCVGSLAVRKQPLDAFFTGGIAILFLSILMAILMNFGILPEHLAIENITKPGVGLEIIALSLSMANRIRLLKTKKEELQTIALQKSEEMNDIKSYFLSNMSHELRTPLNAILGLTTVIENETTDPKVRINCEVIKHASYGLISSVNDILDFSNIDKGKLVLEQVEFKLQTIFQKLNTSAARQLKDKNINFEYTSTLEDNLLVMGDATRLEQIIYNILSNAIKFTNQGSVKFNASHQIANERLQLDLTIADTGVGISKEKIDSVFDMFSQTSINNKRKFGGFGIGLSVVKALVDLQAGTISLQSEPDLGTKVNISISFPFITAKEVPVQQKTTDGYALNDKTILVVEDNKMNQMVLKMMLKNWKNTTVLFADDGSEGLEVLTSKKVDLILMDLQMPVMDGYEAIEAIRKGAAGAQNTLIPIVVLTADVMNSTKDRVFALGANDYMTKPVDQKLLFQKANSLLPHEITVKISA